MIPRIAQKSLTDLAETFRIVIVSGPRQAGKTTLVKQLHSTFGGLFQTLDSQEVLQSALGDSGSFAESGATPRIFDEIQRAGDSLLLAIKQQVDMDNSPCQFVLSSSTNFLTVPNLTESLAGRAVFLNLWPLSMAERCGVEIDWPSLAFGPSPRNDQDSTWGRANYFRAACEGGYPEAVHIQSPDQRMNWFDSYFSTVVLRDIASFADIKIVDALPKLVSLLASRTGSTIVKTDLADALGVRQSTVRDYLAYLEMVYLTATV